MLWEHDYHNYLISDITRTREGTSLPRHALDSESGNLSLLLLDPDAIRDIV